jgi:arylsulfatase
MGWGSASAGPLDLFKMAVAEGGIRSPLLIAGPGIKSSHQVDAFAYVWDTMPTILEMAAISHPETFDGNTIEPLRGKSLTSVLSEVSDLDYDPQEYIGGEMKNGKWMRQGAYKAVSVAATYGAGAWRLLNVVDDPGETQDLAEARAELLNNLKAAWHGYAKEVGVVLMQQMWRMCAASPNASWSTATPPLPGGSFVLSLHADHDAWRPDSHSVP